MTGPRAMQHTHHIDACPFCGGDGTYLLDDDASKAVYVACINLDCMAHGPSMRYSMWNPQPGELAEARDRAGKRAVDAWNNCGRIVRLPVVMA